ncbi:MAG: 4-diphosphocytidyl-2-C-methyl-D-erythritol kinase [Pseudohongiellaceae bacterium]|jgi:4-diphosphocytidyl-2-C-methyl-D-erythritol kinase
MTAPLIADVRHGQAPAKINLYLEVLGRRPDGFHELVTVLQTIDLWDDLSVALRDRRKHIAPGEPDITLELIPQSPQGDSPAAVVPSGPDNLVVRAATALLAQCHAHGDCAVTLTLRKGIPAGGGLGGGSSDAALTLRLLNDLLGSPCDSAALQHLAATLGSDVPFFLTGGTALCRGRGEVVEPISGPRPFELLLHLPGFGLSTPTVFRELNAPLCSNSSDTQRQLDATAFDNASVAVLEELYRNDLEDPAKSSEPRLAALLNAQDLHLSGSGSTLFRYIPTHTSLLVNTSETQGQFVRTASRTR